LLVETFWYTFGSKIYYITEIIILLLWLLFMFFLSSSIFFMHNRLKLNFQKWNSDIQNVMLVKHSDTPPHLINRTTILYKHGGELPCSFHFVAPYKLWMKWKKFVDHLLNSMDFHAKFWGVRNWYEMSVLYEYKLFLKILYLNNGLTSS
jgi:hypothetical protein